MYVRKLQAYENQMNQMAKELDTEILKIEITWSKYYKGYSLFYRYVKSMKENGHSWYPYQEKSYQLPRKLNVKIF